MFYQPKTLCTDNNESDLTDEFAAPSNVKDVDILLWQNKLTDIFYD